MKQKREQSLTKSVCDGEWFVSHDQRTVQARLTTMNQLTSITITDLCMKTN